MILVTTVTFNAAKDGVLTPFLKCLRAQTSAEFRLLIVDNLSTDGTRDLLQANCDAAELLFNDQNLGFAVACNQAIQRAREMGARQILFINNDTEFAPDLVERLVASLEQNGVAAVSPAITYYDRPDLLWYGGGHFSWTKGMINVSPGIEQPVDRLPERPFRTDFAPGCCLLVKLDVFDRIGVFDERFFVYWEDADFCMRMKRAGESLLVDPRIRVQHKVSVSTGGANSRFSLYMFNRNHMIFMRKHFSRWQRTFVLGLVGVKLFVNLIRRRFGLAQSKLIVEALSDGLTAARSPDVVPPRRV